MARRGGLPGAAGHAALASAMLGGGGQAPAEGMVVVSVFAGRVILALVGAMAVGAAVWAALALAGDRSDAAALVAPVVLGVIALVVGLVTAALGARFVDAEVTAGSVTIRRVLGRRRVISAASVDEIIVLSSLVLPARLPVASSPRVVLRRDGVTLAAFTPRDRAFADDLSQLGRDPVVDRRPLTPPQAARHYPGAVSRAEVAAHHLPAVAIVAGAAVAIWAVVRFLAG